MSGRTNLTVLGDILAAAGTEHLTLDWLLGRMGGRSFGLVLRLLSIFGLLPGASAFAAVLLMIPAIQMLLARPGPCISPPASQASIPGAPSGTAGALCRAHATLAGAFRSPALDDARRDSQARCGGSVLLLSAGLLAPVPLSNVPPALAILLIAFGLLCGALAVALVVVAAVRLAAWETMSAAGWVLGPQEGNAVIICIEHYVGWQGMHALSAAGAI